MLLYRRDEPCVSVHEPLLMKYFPAVFCPIHDFPHALLPALALLVPASGHNPAAVGHSGWSWGSAGQMGSQQPGGDRRASPQLPWRGTGLPSQPACQGLLRIQSRLAVHRFVWDGGWEHWQLPGALFTSRLLLPLSVAELHWDIFGIRAKWKHIM